MSDHRRKVRFAAAVGANASGAVRLESDPCLSLKLRRLVHIKDCPSLRPVLASLQMDNQRLRRSDPRPSR